MTLVRILDRMENDGWLERQTRSGGPSRPPSVPQAECAAGAQTDLGHRRPLAQRGIWSGSKRGQRSQLLDLLERVHDNLNTLLPETPSRSVRCVRPDSSARDGTARREKPGTQARARCARNAVEYLHERRDCRDGAPGAPDDDAHIGVGH
jgi:hypothetical protein